MVAVSGTAGGEAGEAAAMTVAVSVAGAMVVEAEAMVVEAVRRPQYLP
jgi:hypothetical protein